MGWNFVVETKERGTITKMRPPAYIDGFRSGFSQSIYSQVNSCARCIIAIES